MNIMVLGANGYLGRKLIETLSKSCNITAVYRNIPRQTGKMIPVSADIDSIWDAMQKTHYDWVVNCVAVYERRDTRIHEIVDANMIFALRVLDCAVECGVKKFLTIDTALPRKLNLYSFTKKQFAEFGKFYGEQYKITFINILLQMFYGEDEPKGRFLSDACRKLVCGEELLLTKGTQKRDIIYIDDVCSAVKLLLGKSPEGFCNIPLGSGEAVSIRRLIEYMREILNSNSKLMFGALPARNYEPDCVADLSCLERMGFVLKYPWKQGIQLLCKKIKDEKTMWKENGAK